MDAWQSLAARNVVVWMVLGRGEDVVIAVKPASGGQPRAGAVSGRGPVCTRIDTGGNDKDQCT